MNPQYQQPTQGQGPVGQTYYQPQYAAPKEQPMGYPPAPAQQQQFAYGHGYNNAPAPPPQATYQQSKPKSTGVARSLCLALLVATLVLLAAVIGLSAGLGVSQRNLHNTQADLARATESPSAVTTVTATPAATGSTSGTSSSASASASADTSNITCPGSNNTMYTSTTDSKKFEEKCGIDYSDDEAEAVGSVKVTSMDACMDACAAQSNCTGAGWGYLSGDDGAEHTCWMKANLTTPHVADSGWAFGILQTSDSDSSSDKRSNLLWSS